MSLSAWWVKQLDYPVAVLVLTGVFSLGQVPWSWELVLCRDKWNLARFIMLLLLHSRGVRGLQNSGTASDSVWALEAADNSSIKLFMALQGKLRPVNEWGSKSESEVVTSKSCKQAIKQNSFWSIWFMWKAFGCRGGFCERPQDAVPMLDRVSSSLLQHGTYHGQSWAHQQHWWHILGVRKG